MKKEVYGWLDENKCWTGPDLCFVNDPENARPFERWSNVDNHWALMDFNHPHMAHKFLLKFTNLKPEHCYHARFSTSSNGENSINDIYCGFAAGFMDLARQGLVEDIDFSWLVTKMNHVDSVDDRLEVVFSFVDRDTALMFKLTYGGQ